MLFNFGKCKCPHTGPGNTGMNYEMGGTILSKTVKEKDLGITMNANMKVSEQCRIAASKGNQVLGMIRRNITYKEKRLIIPLYKAIVSPHLEYCIQAWSPYLKKDIDMLEKIQRRATKLIPGLRDLTYEERLKECGLTTLDTRRLRGRGGQIEVFKIVNGFENIDSNIFFRNSCSSSCFPSVWVRLVYWSLRSTATFVISFHWSLLLAFSLHFSSSFAFLKSLFTQSSHLSCGLPRFLEPSCLFVSALFGSLSNI